MIIKKDSYYIVRRVGGSGKYGGTQYYEYLVTATSNGKLFEWCACNFTDAFFFSSSMIEALPDLSNAHKNFSLKNAEVFQVVLESVGRF